MINWRYHYYRWRYRKRIQGQALQPLYDQPPVSRKQSVFSTKFLVIDCEMNGLDVRTNHLLSIGWVLIENQRIINSSGRQVLIQNDYGGGSSSVIHGLRDANLASAKSVASVILLLLKQMQGCVLVFHHAPIDLRFLQKVAREIFKCPLFFYYLDTMEIESRRVSLQGKFLDLSLSACRDRYGLPDAVEHNALADAMATAELLLAQIATLGGGSIPLSGLGLQPTG